MRIVTPVFFQLILSLAVQAQSTELVIHSSSRLVELSVVAHDKQGRPIQDLTRDDFVIFDSDKQRDIAVFAVQTAEPGPPPGAPQQGQITLSNRAPRQTEHPTAATVILFDSLNLGDLDSLLYGQRELLKFLQTLHPGDPVALYLLAGPQVRVIHDFTDSIDSLVNAAQRASGKLPLNGSGAYSGFGLGQFSALSNFLGVSRLDLSSLERRTTQEWTLSGLEAIANRLEGIPGRKNLVWITRGVDLTTQMDISSFVAAETFGANHELEVYSARVKRLTSVFNRADVAVYPIDPQGLMTDLDVVGRPIPTSPIGSNGVSASSGPVGHASSGGAAEPMPQPSSAVPFMETRSAVNSPNWASMDMFADETGGRAFYNANDMVGSIRRAFEDAKVTYLLGFYVDDSSWDGKYHKLYVRIRRPGTQLRARRGYWASSAREENAEQREESLHNAASSPLEATGIGVTLNLESNPLPLGAHDLVIKVDPRDVRFAQRNGRWNADLDVLFVELTPDGRSLGGQKDQVQCRFSENTYAQTMDLGLFLPRQIYVAPGGARLRVVVRDESTGAEGSISVPIRVEKWDR
ncbi:MAG: VWA domain-containing protein [Bryobacteraceae bacterium]|nr:VWA domain-containing protein [Bryobacteraceae bacterium]